jgi:hypothetical protein
MLSQSTSEMCVLTSETVEVVTDPEWALVLLASRLMSTLKLTSYLPTRQLNPPLGYNKQKQTYHSG